MSAERLNRGQDPPCPLFADVLSRAIAEIRTAGTPVYTFAFYRDHESAAVSVCVDTKQNSARTVASMNEHGMRYFAEAVANGDLETASLWNADTGRSLALGDFTMVNVAQTDLGGIRLGDDFYLKMIRAVMACEAEVAALAEVKGELLFCCSGPKDEAEYVWPESKHG